MKFACALSFGLIHTITIGEKILYAWLTIPVAFVCSIYMMLIEGDHKKAKKNYGYGFQVVSITFNVLWILAINQIYAAVA